MILVAESARWLVTKGQRADARQSLALTMRESEIDSKLAEMQPMAERDAAIGRGSLRELRTPWIRRLVILGIAIAFLSHTTGVNSIMYFAPSVLISTGLSTEAALVATIANGVVSVLGTLVGIYLLTRGIGRRPLLLTGQQG
jgi:major inositol transporter-like SP family MFS transporter